MFFKKNFLLIYRKAHQRIMTKSTIKLAFHVTGVWPLDKSVITPDMLGPAKETSVESALPLVPLTPIHAVAKILRNAIQLEIKEDLLEDNHDSESGMNIGGDDDNADRDQNPFILPPITENANHTSDASSSTPSTTEEVSPLIIPPLPPPLQEIHNAVKCLAESSLECLIRTYNTSPNQTINQPIQLNPPSRLASLPIDAETDRERLLMVIIKEAEQENQVLRRRVMELQAANILNEAYCKTLREQLAFKDKGKGKEKGDRLLGDGLPVLLTDDFFMKRVEEWEKEQQKKRTEKMKRDVDKKAHSEKLAEWKIQKKNRQEAINKINADWEAAKQQWSASKEQWTQDKAAGKDISCHFGVPKPKRGPLPPVIPKPKVRDVFKSTTSEESDAEDEREDDSDLLDAGDAH
ncbi:hypothetical protein QCA50_004341 [Cerrena zonata]|uniref:Uncharacterized protein n=1 Tax=Cerrena zonata TaxID=2478898 RepID=A0AAW0GH06_9APHY